MIKDDLKREIALFTQDLAKIGISISDVASASPVNRQSIIDCRKVIKYLIKKPELKNELLENGKLPELQIIKDTSINVKTLKKHKAYITAMSIMYFNNYNGIAAALNSKKGGK